MTQRYILRKDNTRANVLANAHAFLDRLPDTREFEIVVKRHVKTRSNKQNAALFGLAYPVLSEATGYTPDELHVAFCCRHFGTVEEDVMGQLVRKPVRTTTTNEQGERDVMSAEDFSRFYDMVQQVGAEAGIDVPAPDPFWRQQPEMEARHGS